MAERAALGPVVTKTVKIDEGDGSSSFVKLTEDPGGSSSFPTRTSPSTSSPKPSTSPATRRLGETDRAAEARQRRSSDVVQKESTKTSATAKSSRPSVATKQSDAVLELQAKTVGVLGEGGSNINRTFNFGPRTFYRLKDGRVYEWKKNGLERLTDAQTNRTLAILKTKDDVQLFGSVEAAVEGRGQGKSFGNKSFIDKIDAVQDRLRDNVSEALTFGKVDTNTFNRTDLSKRYTKMRLEVGNLYDEQKTEIQSSGRDLTETKQQYLNRVLPDRENYIRGVLAAAPAAKALIKEVGLASIPLYGTARTWEDSPNWARAVGVAADLAFLIPVVGQVAAISRAGGSITKAAGALTLAEFTGPVRAIANPFSVARSGGRTIRSIAETLDPRNIPLSAVEARFTTIKVPTSATKASRLEASSAALPGDIKVDAEVLRGINPSDAIVARDEVTLKAIYGEKASAEIGSTGSVLKIAQSPIQKVIPGAFSATTDLRNTLPGMTITAGAEVNPITGAALGQFVSPSFSKRFALHADNPRELSAAAQELIDLGKMSDTEMPGMTYYTDPKLLAELEASGKSYANIAEIEMTVKPLTEIPPPSQLLYTRDPVSGKKFTIAIVGPKLTKTQRARIQFLGTKQAFKDMWSSPGSVTGKINKNWKSAGADGAEAVALLKQAENTSDVAEAIKLRNEAIEIIRRGQASISKTSRVTNMPRVSEAALYTGRQDIRGGLEKLGQVQSRGVTGTKSAGSASDLRGTGKTKTADKTGTGRGKPDTTDRGSGGTGRKPTSSTGRTGGTGRGKPDDARGDAARPDQPRGTARDKAKPEARIRGTKTARGHINVKGDIIDRKGRKVSPDAVVAWRQGFGWWVVTPEYVTPRDAFFTRKRPVGVKIAKGPKSAFKTIVALGGKVPRNFQLDLGIVEAKVTGGRTPGLGFERN